tara:strand:+ start:1345 stop:2859 length:1515 start_codon:yes stop_codon:yes gene_type:complete
MKILDCTIRDGGYYNNWDFSNEIIDSYITYTNNLPIDYIEIGYRTPKKNEYFGKYFYMPNYLLDELREKSNKKFAIMLNVKDIELSSLDYLLSPCIGKVDMIRMAVDPQSFKKAIEISIEIKKLGFEVAFNIMYMGKWVYDEGFYSKLKGIENFVDYLYMVDSYGSVYPDGVKYAIRKIKEITTVKLGFHGHNNLELAFINSIEAKNNQIDIIDCTITGMGRGAGNLKTELFLSYLYDNKEFDYNDLADLVQEFENLKEKYNWGTNLPYMISGFNSIPQKKIMDMFTENFLDLASITNIIKNDNLNFNNNLKPFTFNEKFDTVIIIGGGKKVLDILSEIKHLIKNNSNTALIFSSTRFLNEFTNLSIKKYVSLIGVDARRAFNESNKFDNTQFITFESKMNVNTLITKNIIDNSFELKDLISDQIPLTTTNLSFSLANKLTESTIYICGYDGYTESSIGEKEQKLIDNNDSIFKTVNELHKNKFKFLYPTKYNFLSTESIYSLI